jgi:hypothetical protein
MLCSRSNDTNAFGFLNLWVGVMRPGSDILKTRSFLSACQNDGEIQPFPMQVEELGLSLEAAKGPIGEHLSARRQAAG